MARRSLRGASCSGIGQVSIRRRGGTTNQAVRGAAQQGGDNPASVPSQGGRSFDCCQVSIRDPDASHLDWVTAGSRDLTLCPSRTKSSSSGMKRAKNIGSVLSSIGEHFKCKARSTAHSGDHAERSRRRWLDGRWRHETGLISVPLATAMPAGRACVLGQRPAPAATRALRPCRGCPARSPAAWLCRSSSAPGRA